MLKVWLCTDVDGEGWLCFSAKTAGKAKMMYAEQTGIEFLDVRVKLAKNQENNTFGVGEIEPEDALKFGFIDYLWTFCDNCNEDTACVYHNEKIICEDCIESEKTSKGKGA